jgi:serine kinase of HPr protein (carbohydrate metabolism regulator)
MIKVKELVNNLGLKVCAGGSGLDRTVTGGYASDLLSDVMGNASEGQVWVTLQTHKNVMAVASLKDLAAVVLVKGLEPDPDMAKLAEEEGVPVLTTEKPAFEMVGEIYSLLKR